MIDTDNKLDDEVALKNVIIISCVIEDSKNIFSELFLDKVMKAQKLESTW